jgi:hypothetical protein
VSPPVTIPPVVATVTVGTGKVKPTQDGSGYSFTCPGCNATHTIPTTGPDAVPFNGDTSSPTFGGTILIPGTLAPDGLSYTSKRCRFTITAGRIQFGPDCAHGLGGQSADLQVTS